MNTAMQLTTLELAKNEFISAANSTYRSRRESAFAAACIMVGMHEGVATTSDAYDEVAQRCMDLRKTVTASDWSTVMLRQSALVDILAAIDDLIAFWTEIE